MPKCNNQLNDSVGLGARVSADRLGGSRYSATVSGMTDRSAGRYIAGSPVVQAILDRNAALADLIGAAVKDVEDLRCPVASEDEDVVAEVDGVQRLTSLYLEPGVTQRYRPEQLAAVISETVAAAGSLASEQVRQIRARHFLPDRDGR